MFSGVSLGLSVHTGLNSTPLGCKDKALTPVP